MECRPDGNALYSRLASDSTGKRSVEAYGLGNMSSVLLHPGSERFHLIVLPLRLSKETSAKADNGGGVSCNRWAGKGELMVSVEISSKPPPEEPRV